MDTCGGGPQVSVDVEVADLCCYTGSLRERDHEVESFTVTAGGPRPGLGLSKSMERRRTWVPVRRPLGTVKVKVLFGS